MLEDEHLWAARRECARRWLAAGQDLRGYPALSAEEETEETLAAELTKQAEKKPKTG
jgi:hypothetical protein